MARFLFLDRAHITGMRNVSLRPHKAVRHTGNPVLTRDYPWERTRIQVDGNRVLYDSKTQTWRMYYLAQPGRNPFPPVHVDGRKLTGYVTMVGYAESSDGVHWRKPMFRQRTFEDCQETNLLSFNDGQSVQAGVMFDPYDADTSRRYKMLYWDQKNVVMPDGKVRVEGVGRDMVWCVDGPGGEALFRCPYDEWGMNVAVSGDGIHWKRDPASHVLDCYSDTGHSVLYDERLQRYVAFGRFNYSKLNTGASFHAGRSVARIESKDFIHWSDPELVLTIDENDPADFILNSMPICLYEGIYIGILEVDRRPKPLPIQLAASRDGRHWTRLADRFEFMDQAPSGSWDGGGMCRSGSALFVVGDRIYTYYCSGPTREDSFAGIGLMTWRRDGFVSVHAGAVGGELLTAAVICEAAALHLNIDASAGQACVQVCDLLGRPIKRFADGGWSLPVTGDQLDEVVKWKTDGGEVTGTSGLAALVGEAVTFRIRLANADLYSFWFDRKAAQ